MSKLTSSRQNRCRQAIGWATASVAPAPHQKPLPDRGHQGAEQQRSYVDYLAQLVEGETALRENRSIERRIRNARFPVLKTLEEFQWSWPKKITPPQNPAPVPPRLHRNPDQRRPERPRQDHLSIAGRHISLRRNSRCCRLRRRSIWISSTFLGEIGEAKPHPGHFHECFFFSIVLTALRHLYALGSISTVDVDGSHLTGHAFPPIGRQPRHLGFVRRRSRHPGNRRFRLQVPSVRGHLGLAGCTTPRPSKDLPTNVVGWLC